MKRIDFETAKLAKEVGYNNPSCFYYNPNTKVEFTHEPITETNLSYCHGEISSVYQAELQEWLRNVHNIHVNVDWFCTDPHSWDCQVSNIGDEAAIYSETYIVNWSEELTCQSYEEALEEGMREALKYLIEKNEK